MEVNLAEQTHKSVVSPARIIILLITLFILRGFIYATIIPLWSAPDEPGHYQYAERIAKRVSPGLKVDALYGGNHIKYGDNPTGYYWVAGLAGILPASNATLVTRAYILRFLSIILSAGVIYFTYRLAFEAFPEDRYIYLGAPMIVAMLPMYTFTGMSINVDNLAVFIFTLFLWQAVRTLARGFDFLTLTLMVLAVVAGGLTKRTTFVSIVIFVILPFFFIFREKAKNRSQMWTRLFTVGMAAVGATIALPLLTGMGLSFAKLNMRTFFFTGGQVSTIVSSGMLDVPVAMFISTFWGKFGWADVPINESLYRTLQQVWYLPAAGYTFLITKLLVTRRAVLSRVQLIILVFLAAVVAMVVTIVLTFQPAIGASVTAWLPQARYAWTVLGAAAFLFIVGVIKAVGRKYAVGAFIVLALSMFFFDLSVLFTVIIPRYFTQLSPGAVIWRDPIQTIHPSLIREFRFLALSNTDIKTIISWQPAVINSGRFYTLLFLLYVLVFSLFLALAVKDRGREQVVDDTDDEDVFQNERP